MSQRPTHQGCSQQSPSPAIPAALLPLLVLTFVLLVLVIGSGLVYVAFTHPSLSMPLTVAASGVTLVFTIAGVLVAVLAAQRL